MPLQDIGTARQCHEHAQRGRQPAEAVLQEALLYVLLVIDGTWRQAKEMYKVPAASDLRYWIPVVMPVLHCSPYADSTKQQACCNSGRSCSIAPPMLHPHAQPTHAGAKDMATRICDAGAPATERG